ncbi:MAG: LacI family transcriptional regulator [Paenibacillaceae bacterium]|nr:LacI family transcriptional regulator [Paenibacillaceae bacterium]
MATKISMQTIADRLGISKFTVSQALNGKPGVSGETRRRVADMAQMLGYKVNALQDSVKELPVPQQTVLVSIRKEFRNEPDFWLRVLDGVSASCAVAGWKIRIAEDEAAPPRIAPEEDAVGIIVLGITPRNHLLALRGLGLPMVLVDHDDPLLQTDVILNNNMEASRIAFKRLVNKGCSSLAFIGRDSLAVSFRERWWGCKLAADEWRKWNPGMALGLTKWTVPSIPGQWVQYLARRLSASPPGTVPDGFVCANDRIALALLEALAACGVQVPEQTLVIGIDNIEAAAASVPGLTSIYLAKEQLGARAVEALQRRVAFRHAIPEKIMLSAELISRHSG